MTAGQASVSLGISTPGTSATTGTKAAFAVDYTLNGNLGSTEVALKGNLRSLKSSVPLPISGDLWRTDVLRAGKIVSAVDPAIGGDHRAVLDGPDVKVNVYSTDGRTLAYAYRVTGTESVSLAGIFGVMPLDVRYSPALLSVTRDSSLVDANAAISDNARALRLAYKRVGETVFVRDCIDSAYGRAQPAGKARPCAGSPSTIESELADLATVITGRPLTLADGRITTVEGVRAWVSTADAPVGSSATPAKVIAFELAGEVYVGLKQADGASLRSLTPSDAYLYEGTVRYVNCRVSRPGASTTNNPVTCQTGSSIEQELGDITFIGFGQVLKNGDGQFIKLAGYRTWISNALLPSTFSSVGGRLVIQESASGAIYMGILDMTRGAAASVSPQPTVDTTIRFNKLASDDIAAALKL